MQFGYRSQTTISTFEEVTTPRSANQQNFNFGFSFHDAKPVEGPRGPHLFRSSHSSGEFDFKHALQLSPLTLKMPPSRAGTAPDATPVTAVPIDRLPSAVAGLNGSEVRSWTSRQVADWMYRAGFEETIIHKFERHDITGTVLLDMQFEDLKELDIHSFGKRHRVWNEIHALRNSVEGETISLSYTPFEDISRPCTGAARSKSRNHRGREQDGEDACTPITPGGGRRRRGRRARRADDDELLTPAESLSIVAIEQLLPKPHRCARGERCAKWRRQQRQMAALRDEHGFPISPEKGGQIFVAGNPGNADVAKNVVENVHLRPNSDIVPSVVASSDVLGPGPLPTLEALRDVESRDPQENVKQFLTLQGLNIPPPVESPPTPPLEMFPPLQSQLQSQSAPPLSQANGPHAGLRSLPRLSIPRSYSAGPALPKSAVGGPDSATFSPCRTAVDSPAVGLGAPHQEIPVSQVNHALGGPDRFGTPASEMDVPVTAVDLGPISRNASQSVPPNMQYSNSTNVASPNTRNASRRPSFAMPALAEDKVFSPQNVRLPQPPSTLSRANTQRSTRSNSSNAGTAAATAATAAVTTAQNVLRRASNRRSSSSTSTSSAAQQQQPAQQADQTQSQQYQYSNTQHAGWMRKRRTRLLRHEWTPAHFRLTGTQLAMHRDEHPTSEALSTIDVDDYAVACSAIASGKLAAKLKALKFTASGGPLGSTFNNFSSNQNRHDSSDNRKTSKPGSDDHGKDDGKTDPAAFSFQLVPSGHGNIYSSSNNTNVSDSGALVPSGRPSMSTSSLRNIAVDGTSRESLDSGSGSTMSGTKSNGHHGSNKTHHFAVKSRDDRIEWMRELMLAKALKAKGEGYEVKVNGNAV